MTDLLDQLRDENPVGLDGLDVPERLRPTAAAVAARPHRWRVLAAAVTLTVAAVFAAILATTGERSLDPVAEARAALAPPGEIVYMKITSTNVAPGATSVPPPRTTEQWSTLDPPRWRLVQHPSPGGSSDGRLELSYADGVTRNYRSEQDTLHVISGYRAGSSAERLPSALGQGSGDPAVDLRSLLQGSVSDKGEQQVRGRTVRRFVVEQRRRGANGPATTLRLVYDVDPQTFAPLEGRLSVTFGPRNGPARITTIMRVDAYRRIPLTASTAKLLKIKTTPKTKASFETQQQLRARLRASRARCHRRDGGVLVCPPPDRPTIGP